MNVGDKLYCIKDFKNASDTIYYEKGKTYAISDKFKRVMTNIDYEFYVYTIPHSKSVTTTLSDLRVSMHFMSLKELRKQKLDKLNEKL